MVVLLILGVLEGWLVWKLDYCLMACHLSTCCWLWFAACVCDIHLLKVFAWAEVVVPGRSVVDLNADHGLLSL